MAHDEWVLSERPCVREWISKISELCIIEGQHTGIYPSLIIAQTILESHAGTSNLARNHFNFFGMTMPAQIVGSTAVFWDGQTYTRANYVSNRSWADYTQAGDYDSGFVMSLRHYGMNFWLSRGYGEHGVLNHISKGLSVEAAKEDAKKQLTQIVAVYAPPQFADNNGYEEEILIIIEMYDLWIFDEIFLARGGWDGVSPYS